MNLIVRALESLADRPWRECDAIQVYIHRRWSHDVFRKRIRCHQLVLSVEFTRREMIKIQNQIVSHELIGNLLWTMFCQLIRAM